MAHDEQQQQPGARQRGSLYQRQSPEVYRRRRMVVGCAALIILLALVALIAWGAVLLFGSDEESQQPSQMPSVEQSAAPTPEEPAQSESAQAAEVPSCAAGAIVVEAGTDAQSYPADAQPVLELRVTSTGDEPCQLNVGSSQQNFVVTPAGGSDPLFASSYCMVDPSDQMMTFEPGEREAARLTWDRLGVDPDCTENITPEPGEYELTVQLGEVRSEPVTFVLE